MEQGILKERARKGRGTEGRCQVNNAVRDNIMRHKLILFPLVETPRCFSVQAGNSQKKRNTANSNSNSRKIVSNISRSKYKCSVRKKRNYLQPIANLAPISPGSVQTPSAPRCARCASKVLRSRQTSHRAPAVERSVQTSIGTPIREFHSMNARPVGVSIKSSTTPTWWPWGYVLAGIRGTSPIAKSLRGTAMS